MSHIEQQSVEDSDERTSLGVPLPLGDHIRDIGSGHHQDERKDADNLNAGNDHAERGDEEQHRVVQEEGQLQTEQTDANRQLEEATAPQRRMYDRQLVLNAERRALYADRRAADAEQRAVDAEQRAVDAEQNRLYFEQQRLDAMQRSLDAVYDKRSVDDEKNHSRGSIREDRGTGQHVTFLPNPTRNGDTTSLDHGKEENGKISNPPPPPEVMERHTSYENAPNNPGTSNISGSSNNYYGVYGMPPGFQGSPAVVGALRAVQTVGPDTVNRLITRILMHFFVFHRSNDDLKDIGGACAVVSTFVALVAIGLLSYTNDIFSDKIARQPSDSAAPVSDVAVTALFFTAVILSIAAAMEFTILQLTVTRMPRSRPVGGGYGGYGGYGEYGARRSRRMISTGNVNGNIERMMASFCFTLLFLSWATLFAGILTFIWSNESHAVKIATTVVFGTLCLLPILHVSVFISSFE
ncbi:hypothetical protein SCHPADRAFT_61037 [Schizopora paradoxa]|uniref:Uncharacterized protein n=1 Tax=Schizopora paradoxa TaxID=27342 RepID=A0A0H2S698_9AGAM|nr:hypothetical protein SCHPADRAFT_61037 [Schizopora paradoxa]